MVWSGSVTYSQPHQERKDPFVCQISTPLWVYNTNRISSVIPRVLSTFWKSPGRWLQRALCLPSVVPCASPNSSLSTAGGVVLLPLPGDRSVAGFQGNPLSQDSWKTSMFSSQLVAPCHPFVNNKLCSWKKNAVQRENHHCFTKPLAGTKYKLLIYLCVCFPNGKKKYLFKKYPLYKRYGHFTGFSLVFLSMLIFCQ